MTVFLLRLLAIALACSMGAFFIFASIQASQIFVDSSANFVGYVLLMGVLCGWGGIGGGHIIWSYAGRLARQRRRHRVNHSLTRYI